MPELEVRDGFKIQIKILIALIDSYTISALSFSAHPDKTQAITIIVIRKNKFAFFINSLAFR